MGLRSQMIVVIPCSVAGSKLTDSEWLPRQCPACQQMAVIGHGRRLRQTHDREHDSIRVRRGICKACQRTLTALPGWCVPQAIYGLAARGEALQRRAEGASLEEAAPECLQPDRVADAATIRRWIRRRIESLFLCAKVSWRWMCTPTLVAWDWRSLARILMPERCPP